MRKDSHHKSTEDSSDSSKKVQPPALESPLKPEQLSFASQVKESESTTQVKTISPVHKEKIVETGFSTTSLDDMPEIRFFTKPVEGSHTCDVIAEDKQVPKEASPGTLIELGKNNAPASFSSEQTLPIGILQKLNSNSSYGSNSNTSPLSPSSNLLKRRMNRLPSGLNSPKEQSPIVQSQKFSIGVATKAKAQQTFLKHSYKYFLAVRPQCWEENAVNMVLESLESSKPRICFSNLALSSSFLVARNFKKLHPDRKDKVFCDVGITHLYFHDNMIREGQTQFKTSPPNERQDQQKALVRGAFISMLSIR